MPIHKRFVQRSRAVLPYFLAAMFVFTCCTDDETGPPPPTARSDQGTLDGEPNSWIHKSITLPSKASKFSFRTCAHNRDGATGSLRVRLADDGGTWHTLLDWEQMTGVEGEYNWVNRSADITMFAGKTVRFYIEQGDDDIGTHEQRYVDTITIKYTIE